MASNGGAEFSGTIDALWRIASREGPASLWRGTRVSLLMAVPMVGVYLPLYDRMLAAMHDTAWAPLAAGSGSRAVAVLATAPFELIRTRLQAAGPSAAGVAAAGVACQPCDCGGPASTSTTSRFAGSSWSTPRVTTATRLASAAKLWRGVGSQLARDVPFSALYWAGVEPMRAALLRGRDPDDPRAVFGANVTAGAVSGAAAGVLTTPLDVVKTRVQVSAAGAGPGPAPSMLSVLRSIAAREGLRGLFAGWSARAGKAAPACAIVLSSYEGLKHWHAR